MIATVDKVSPYGLMIAGDWKNLTKFGPKPDISGIRAGDQVEIELQKDKFIVAVKKVGADAAPASAAAPRQAAAPANDARQQSICRQSAWNAVLGSAWLGKFYETMDYAQAVSEAKALVEKIVEYTAVGAN